MRPSFLTHQHLKSSSSSSSLQLTAINTHIQPPFFIHLPSIPHMYKGVRS
ncbi:hypothetical protein HanXRQr2_Chr04g0179691 [Helianthus annuus]|uniref:Uncharacterized protein n=1 Tax=Helianthus annuus TaxID=4232 RepID=A0A9K3J9I6_HELAN|nr:hypothetical protein HanXRQr2_Chr04g0179691 [Helianthus annuus]KAJ0932397.1 hypothetical protein HanPSC8_Chr04g0173191 [Helianthus annuus]